MNQAHTLLIAEAAAQYSVTLQKFSTDLVKKSRSRSRAPWAPLFSVQSAHAPISICDEGVKSVWRGYAVARTPINYPAIPGINGRSRSVQPTRFDNSAVLYCSSSICWQTLSTDLYLFELLKLTYVTMSFSAAYRLFWPIVQRFFQISVPSSLNFAAFSPWSVGMLKVRFGQKGWTGAGGPVSNHELRPIGPDRSADRPFLCADIFLCVN